MPKLLDLFCGRLGWSKAFLAKGWDVLAVDLVKPPEIPHGVEFIQRDVLEFFTTPGWFYLREEHAVHSSWKIDAIVASPPCEEFSVHGMKCFHPNPEYPALGIKLFNYTRMICECAKIPYIIENVRAAEQFVGRATHHAGPFYLWGSMTPPLLHRGIIKGKSFRGAPGAWMDKRPDGVTVQDWRNKWQQESERLAGGRRHCASVAATIPPELSHVVCDYAERLLEQKAEISFENVRS